MSVRLAVLGLLIERPSYGYELAQRLESRFAHWNLSPTGVYGALNKLEDDKQVRIVGERPAGGRRAPRRTVYESTPQGVSAYCEWFAESSAMESNRQELDMKILLASPESLPLMIELALRQETVCMGELAALTRATPPDSVSAWEQAAALLNRNSRIKWLQFRIERLQEARSVMQTFLGGQHSRK
jgi:DNA-binding PadR family transcriptional regulator